MKEFNYNFALEDAIRFRQFMGTRDRRRGDEMQFEFCPYCQGGSSKDKWTFSINMRTGQNNCMRGSCGIQGNMITLARDFNFQLNEDVSRYYNINNYNAKFRTFKEAHLESKPAAIKYLTGRGISEDIIKRYEITTKKDEDGILVFPFKNEKGELKFIKYRNTEFVKGESKGGKEWCESKCMPILFGMNHCNPNNKTLILTEGQIDSLSVTQSGFENAVSVPLGKNGFTWIPHCWDWLQNFEKIIVFGDLEDGEISLLDTVRKRFKNMSVFHVRIEDYKGCKDANDILRKYGAQQIGDCIKNAVEIPLEHIVKAADVKPVNLFDLEKLETGIASLDKDLYGGLPYGNVTIISGKAGEGKSTFASQILMRALDKRIPCLAYSGELPNYVFKNWIDCQFAGSRMFEYHIDQFDDLTRKAIDPEDQEKISEWYRDLLYLVDSDSILDENGELIEILEIIENSIIRYGFRVILIDNLMTAINLYTDPAGDKYEKQSKFMNRLVILARKYNVLIILVAHQKKGDNDNKNEGISGTADIGNLAAVTLAYEKDKSISPVNRRLSIVKSRLFSIKHPGGWVMQYDEFSRRVEEADADITFHLLWEEDSNGFIDVPENGIEDIPF